MSRRKITKIAATKFRVKIAKFISHFDEYSFDNLDKDGAIYELLLDAKVTIKVLERLLEDGSVSKQKIVADLHNYFDDDFDVVLNAKKMNSYSVAAMHVMVHFKDLYGGQEQLDYIQDTLVQHPSLIYNVALEGLKKITDEEVMEKWVPPYLEDKKVVDRMKKMNKVKIAHVD